jgi:acetyl-CoA acetyltransferase
LAEMKRPMPEPTPETLHFWEGARAGEIRLQRCDQCRHVYFHRARDFPRKPVYILGTGESVETPMVSQMEDFTTSKAFRVSGKKAFNEAGITHADVDHLMIYDAFAHLPLYGLEDLGFCKPGEAAAFIAGRNTAPGGKLPLNTNGGGLSYMHSGMYGMYAMQESIRQLRGIAPAQAPGAKISIAHGVGGMFAASGTIVFSNQAP